MKKKENQIYVEPKSYFSPGMRRTALEYDIEHNVETNENTYTQNATQTY